MTFLQVEWEGNDITNETIRYERQDVLCNSYGSIAIQVDGHVGRNYQVWDDIIITEDSSKVGEYFISDIQENDQDGSILIGAENAIKKINDYFVPRLIKTGYTSTAKYWIQQFLDDATVSYNFTDTGNGATLSDSTTFEPDSALNLITPLLQQSGWYMYFDENNVAQIGKLDVSGSPVKTYTDRDILSINVSTDDEMLRNKALVWGNVDILSGERIKAVVYRPTPWDYDSNDVRPVAIGNLSIRNTATAYSLADKVLREFDRPTVVKTIQVAGPQNISLGDFIKVESGAWYGTGKVTQIQVAWDGGVGFTTTITIDQRCPRIFGYHSVINDYVYIGTENNGVWRKLLSSGSWSDYSAGLPSGIGITDLHIYNDVFVCTTFSGEAYYRTIDQNWNLISLSGGFTDGNGESFPSSGVDAKYCIIDRTSNNEMILGVQRKAGSGRAWHVRFNPLTSNLVRTPIYLSGKHNLELMDITRTTEDDIASVREPAVYNITTVVSGTINSTKDGGWGVGGTTSTSNTASGPPIIASLPIITSGSNELFASNIGSSDSKTSNMVVKNDPGTDNGTVWYIAQTESLSNLWYVRREEYDPNTSSWDLTTITTTTVSGIYTPLHFWTNFGTGYYALANHPDSGNEEKQHYEIDESTGNWTKTILYDDITDSSDHFGGTGVGKYYIEHYEMDNGDSTWTTKVAVIDMESATYTITDAITSSARLKPMEGEIYGWDGFYWLYVWDDGDYVYGRLVTASTNGSVNVGNTTLLYSYDSSTEGGQQSRDRVDVGPKDGREWIGTYLYTMGSANTNAFSLRWTQWSTGGKTYRRYYNIIIGVNLDGTLAPGTVSTSLYNSTDDIWEEDGIHPDLWVESPTSNYRFVTKGVGNIYGGGYLVSFHFNDDTFRIRNNKGEIIGTRALSDFNTPSLTFLYRETIVPQMDCTEEVIYAVLEEDTGDHYLVGMSPDGTIVRQFYNRQIDDDIRGKLNIYHNMVVYGTRGSTIGHWNEGHDYNTTRTDRTRNYHILKRTPTSGAWENIKPSGTRNYIFDENLALPLVIFPRHYSGYLADTAGFVYANNLLTESGWYTEQGSRGIELFMTHDSRTFSATGGFVVESGTITENIMSKIGIVGGNALRVIDANLSGYYSTVRTFSGIGEPYRFETSNIDNPPYMFVAVSGVAGGSTFHQRNPTNGTWYNYSTNLPSGVVTIIRMDDTK